jgi:hypothetical protein
MTTNRKDGIKSGTCIQPITSSDIREFYQVALENPDSEAERTICLLLNSGQRLGELQQ